GGDGREGDARRRSPCLRETRQLHRGGGRGDGVGRRVVDPPGAGPGGGPVRGPPGAGGTPCRRVRGDRARGALTLRGPEGPFGGGRTVGARPGGGRSPSSRSR